MTLNDLERRNNHNDCLISSNSVASWADYIKVVEDTLRQNSRTKNVVFSDISLMAIGRGSPLARTLKRGTPLSPAKKWTVTWKRCKIESKLLLMTNSRI